MRTRRRGAVGLLALLAARPSWGGGVEPVRLPDGSALPAVDFDRHVASLFGRLGCNAGSCHGSFQGRGGLNLSLFGHDPARDFQAITRGASGRRVNVLDPDRSLVLLKATGQVPHEGGSGSRPGRGSIGVIRAWIAGGAQARPVAARALGRSRSGLPKSRLERPGGTGRLAVVARFADGAEADVTPFCDLRVRDAAVADVSNAGIVRGLRPGDTAVVASYNGLVAAARVLVPTGRTVTVPDVPASDLIDREVFAKLRTLGIAPSGPAADAEFLRRVTLDVIGTLPTPGEVRAFLADGSCDKRSKTIDGLLAHPMHAALWATRYLDITGCDVDRHGRARRAPRPPGPALARLVPQAVRREHALRPDRPRRPLRDQPRRTTTPALGPSRGRADSIALKDGSETDYADRPGLDLFWRRLANGEPSPVEPLAERVAAAFLGVRIECAQCHKHPFDRWTQADYRSFANIFADVQFGLSPDGLRRGRRPARRAAQGRSRTASCRRSLASARSISRARSARRLADPDTGRPLAPRALGGPELPDDGDLRERLFAWLAAPDNPYFARSFVNRVWAVYFGAGLVDPVDGFSVANPPSNPRLLDALAADFVAHGYDIRRLERLILNSAGLPAVVAAGGGEPRRPRELRPVDAEADDGRGPGRRAQRRAGRPGRFRPRRPEREPGRSRSPRTGWRRPTSRASSGSSAAPNGRRSATASGRRRRHCRRRSSS